MPADSGTLYVIATPIGNLDDISARAIATLRRVGFILAEDTRHTGRLMQQLGVTTPMRSFHEHNERTKTASIINSLRSGQDVALVCDAGTPLVSDPGSFLISQAHDHALTVHVIPGPCALVAALSISGMAASSFVFAGFLPPRKAPGLRALQALQHETRTLVFYEAPHRIADFLAAAKAVFGPDRKAMLGRELTKKFEQVRKADLAELMIWLASNPDHQRGEFVVIVAGAAVTRTDTDELIRIITLLPESLSLRDVVELTCEITGANKNQVYALALTIRSRAP